MTTTLTKTSKTHFKCFNCQLLVLRREGTWVDWNTMQVNLCPACVKSTTVRPERQRNTVKV